MSFAPPPPPGYQQPQANFQHMQQRSAVQQFRRPQVWVPPIIMLDAFAAGYAIPWNLGPEPMKTFAQLIFPLIVLAVTCGVAGFYTYRTVRGWQMWTWIAFGVSVFNVLSLVLAPVLMVPEFVIGILITSTVGVFVCAIAGAERPAPIHYR